MKPIFIHARGEQIDPIKNLRDKAKGLTALDEGYVDYVKGIYVAFAGDIRPLPLLSILKREGTFISFVTKKEGYGYLFLIKEGEVSLAGGRLPKEVSYCIKKAIKGLATYGGTLNPDGSIDIDLLSPEIGPHYGVNLLLGDRTNSEEPLLSTPKSVVDSLGRGSFRAEAAYQVLASRWDIRPEENGNPFNRQFYLVEDGNVIFYSGQISSSVVSATAHHGQNVTVITYVLKGGLTIERTIWLFAQKEGCPEALEIQEVRLFSPKERDIEIIFTGMFGFSNPNCVQEDVIYQTVIQEGSLLLNDEHEILAISPHYYPEYLKDHVRFFGLSVEGQGYAESFTNDATAFLGGGDITSPRGINSFDNKLGTKGASFFALKKKVHVKANEKLALFTYTGAVASGDNPEKALEEKVAKFLGTYGNIASLVKERKERRIAFEKYASSFSTESGRPNFDAMISYNLPFQTQYQTFLSRAFAQTQKGYRQIGFREIQDLFASIPYFVAEGKGALSKELLRKWIENVYRFGYANHNFYYEGKEPGMCSDDAIWLFIAVAIYLRETGDQDILHEEFLTAEKDSKRPLIDTLLRIALYSGRISTGKHGLPLLDRADWNDCLKIDGDYCLMGPDKEKLYYQQVEQGLIKDGERMVNDLSESVMNAFLYIAGVRSFLKEAKLSERERVAFEELVEEMEKNSKEHAYIKGYYARVLINRESSKIKYVGAIGDGLSEHKEIDNGSFYLNSFSWSVLASMANEEQIASMLTYVDKYLKTSVGYRLASEEDLTLTGNRDSATSHYFLGDRENGGVFKHATMMFVNACFKASREVKDLALKERLLDDAYFMLDHVYPYIDAENPYIKKGNPRFCTQYCNPMTLEDMGPILSGTATWLTLNIKELSGISFLGDGFYPLLPKEVDKYRFSYKKGETSYIVEIKKPKGRYAYKASSVNVDGVSRELASIRFNENDGGTHHIAVVLE